MLDKGTRKRKLSSTQKKNNKKKSRIRAKVEHPFAFMKKTLNDTNTVAKTKQRNDLRFTMNCIFVHTLLILFCVMKSIITFLITIILCFFSTFCALKKTPKNTNSHIYIQKKTTEHSAYKLIWEDNFDGDKIDTTKWSKVKRGNADWNNYMTNNDKCYAVKDGNLHLRGVINEKDSMDFLTGGLLSLGKFAFQYGKIEIRANLPKAKGAWPAIWLLSETKKYGEYPKNGEIDIMERLNFDDFVYQTVHSYYTLELKKETPQRFTTAKINEDFNIYSLEWLPDKLVFQVNGETTLIYPKSNDEFSSQWPFDQPFYIILSEQLGGNWVGEINPKDLPVDMIIDWVRVYQ